MFYSRYVCTRRIMIRDTKDIQLLSSLTTELQPTTTPTQALLTHPYPTLHCDRSGAYHKKRCEATSRRLILNRSSTSYQVELAVQSLCLRFKNVILRVVYWCDLYMRYKHPILVQSLSYLSSTFSHLRICRYRWQSRFVCHF